MTGISGLRSTLPSFFSCARNPLAVSIGRFAARSSVGGTRRMSRMRVGQRRNGNRYPNLPKGFNTTSANDVRQMALRSPIAAPVPGTPTANKAVTVWLLGRGWLACTIGAWLRHDESTVRLVFMPRSWSWAIRSHLAIKCPTTRHGLPVSKPHFTGASTTAVCLVTVRRRR